MGGRLTLVKSVLEAIPIFWHALAYIPKGVLEKIRKKVLNFSGQGREKFKVFVS
jgi:hypothetical protein